MKLTARVVGRLDDVIDAQAAELSDHLRRAVATSASRLRDELRDQVRAAGLGRGLEKAWREVVYPQRRVRTFRPAGLVYSNATLLHEVFDEGATVVARRSKYLVIPTKAGERLGLGEVRSSRKGGSIPGRATRRYADLGAFADRIGAEVVSASKARNAPPELGRRHRGGGSRIVLTGARGGDLTAVLHRRGAQPVVVAVLKPSVRIARRTDIAGAARRAEATLASLIESAS